MYQIIRKAASIKNPTYLNCFAIWGTTHSLKIWFEHPLPRLPYLETVKPHTFGWSTKWIPGFFVILHSLSTEVKITYHVKFFCYTFHSMPYIETVGLQLQIIVVFQIKAITSYYLVTILFHQGNEQPNRGAE